ncbi:Uncharacterised protein [Salmonella enterica subsp. enterica serovar Typhi]|nr:Uncharacterised protein [Salmonella enterica subsp. enterica serovar Typhi]CNV08397.1 Uncharacterised protein [Salmonella enterica subsp. enterica serovar Bovismorbificans]CGW41775.1 Uncharacterised protein [Salmonella enterica subsp. enterica serovar Typhi]CGW66112.1 Uncharacterised protein [Salmonella enterica subsp. enterica serovar Typhi]CGY10773.1 Uncharacterised protein [Salmonella enterica subsp. enterica serovar Typhi]
MTPITTNGANNFHILSLDKDINDSPERIFSIIVLMINLRNLR